MSAPIFKKWFDVPDGAHPRPAPLSPGPSPLSPSGTGDQTTADCRGARPLAVWNQSARNIVPQRRRPRYRQTPDRHRPPTAETHRSARGVGFAGKKWHCPARSAMMRCGLTEERVSDGIGKGSRGRGAPPPGIDPGPALGRDRHHAAPLAWPLGQDSIFGRSAAPGQQRRSNQMLAIAIDAFQSRTGGRNS
jgi:hypothetical protein